MAAPAYRDVPGPKGRPFVGAFQEFIEDSLGFCWNAFEEYGRIAHWKMFGYDFYLISHPDDIQKILKTDQQLFVKGPSANRILPLVGRGLLLSEGELWRKQRRLVQPAFHPRRISKLIPTISNMLDQTLDHWSTIADKKGTIEVQYEMSKLTFQVVCKAILGSEVEHLAKGVNDALAICLDEFPSRINNLLAPPLWIPTPTNQRIKKALYTLDKAVLDVIQTRRALKDKPEDLMTSFIDGRYEDGSQMSDSSLRDELMTLMLAGYDTTSNLLTWTMILLSENPEWEEKIAAECSTFNLSSDTTMSDLMKLTNLGLVLQESLRLYPPAWAFLRTPTQNYQLHEFEIKKGSNLIISPWLTHRHPDFWPDAEKFQPDRMQRNQLTSRHPFAFIPFGGGDRICIGSNFALIEAMVVMCKIMQRFQLVRPNLSPIIASPKLTLKPDQELHWTLRIR